MALSDSDQFGTGEFSFRRSGYAGDLDMDDTIVTPFSREGNSPTTVPDPFPNLPSYPNTTSFNEAGAQNSHLSLSSMVQMATSDPFEELLPPSQESVQCTYGLLQTEDMYTDDSSGYRSDLESSQDHFSPGASSLGSPPVNPQIGSSATDAPIPTPRSEAEFYSLARARITEFLNSVDPAADVKAAGLSNLSNPVPGNQNKEVFNQDQQNETISPSETLKDSGSLQKRKRPESPQSPKGSSDGERPTKRPRGRPRIHPLPLDANGNPIQPPRKKTPPKPKSLSPEVRGSKEFPDNYKYHRSSPAQILIHHSYGQPAQYLTGTEAQSFSTRLLGILEQYPQNQINCIPIQSIQPLDEHLELFRRNFGYDF
ncbi:hypothetical protein TWF281_010795 [Arthrobotrys megalospora]